MNEVTFWCICPLLGALSGILAGLLGIGGGLVLVPALYAAELAMGVPDALALKLALGTSMATIAVTGISSALNHHRRGAVVWEMVWRCMAGLIVGAIVGAMLVKQLNINILKIFFSLFGIFLGLKMLFFGAKNQAVSDNIAIDLPKNGSIFAASSLVGMVSALVGIGGGTLNVPLFLRWRCSMTQAIGTAAACGVPIAWGGVVGYVWQGWDVANLPPHSVGFVAWIAVILLGMAGIFSARWGVALAHYLPAKQLKRIFAAILICVGIKMGWSAV